MKKVKTLFQRLSRRNIVIIALSLLLVGGGVLAFSSGSNGYDILVVENGTVESEVLVIGQTKSSSSVELGFERSGRVLRNNTEVGKRVNGGDTLVVLEQDELLADLRKAEANLQKAEVDLLSIRQSAPASYEGAYNTLVASILDAFIKADDAVRNSADQFFTNPRSTGAKFDPGFDVEGASINSGASRNIRADISNERVALETLLNNWSKSQSNIGRNGESLTEAFELAQSNLRKVSLFLDNVAFALNLKESTNTAESTTNQASKDSLSSARTKVNTSLSNLLTSKASYDSAPKALLGTAGSGYDKVLAQEAVVAGLRADVASINASINKTVLRAPISGVITQADAKRGEIVTAGTILVSIISESKLQIEANVSEINIGRVAVGNIATVSFDAFEDREFKGKVIYIDPGETIVDGVPTYKVTVLLDESVPQGVRSGLTANLRILTDKREEVVKIPSYALESRGEGHIILVTRDGNTEERVVEVGLRGSDGSVEIISGLEVGEKILVNNR